MNSAASDPILIGIDWGTSSFRAFLIGAGAAVLDRIEAPHGIRNVKGGQFDGTLTASLRGWPRSRDLPVVISGMITSRNGWVETPYLDLPADASDLARALVPHRASDGTALHFVTGMTTRDEIAPDVMRGEETQIVGAAASDLRSGIFVLPGTHSKWVRVEDGRIKAYATYMTGDFFAAVKSHTILGALVQEAPFNNAAFEAGVRTSMKTGTELLHTLFSARTLPLFGQMPAEEISDYISGLLIGAELQAACGQGMPDQRATLIAGPDLAERYEIALGLCDFDVTRAPADVVARGHYEIAHAGGVVQ